MSDDFVVQLERELEAETSRRRPDLDSVLRRGRRIRARRRTVFAFSLVAAGAVVVAALAFLPVGNIRDDSIDVPPVPPAGIEQDSTGQVIEALSEQEEAEIFAFRAMAATELMNPYGKRSYNFTYREDTTKASGGWRVGFSAADCEPRTIDGSLTFTCRGLSGEDELGNSATDTFVIVRVRDDRLEVAGVEGNMLPDEKERLVGYSLSRVVEPSHWEFPSVGLWPASDTIEMFALWVGPYPTKAPGSICELTVRSADGQIVERRQLMYQEPPSRPFDSGGWIHGTGVSGDGNPVSGTVECTQYTGRGWKVESEPEMIETDEGVVGVSATLVWGGPEGVTTPARCSGSLVDAEGEVVWEGSGSVSALWRPGELKNYPYRTDTLITTGGEPVDASAVGDFNCTSK